MKTIKELLLLEALQDIAEPMKKIQEEAKASGCKVNGLIANDLCNDANWLRDKARRAIREYEIRGQKKTRRVYKGMQQSILRSVYFMDRTE